MTVVEVVGHQQLRIALLEEQVGRLTAANHQLAEELKKMAPEKFEALKETGLKQESRTVEVNVTGTDGEQETVKVDPNAPTIASVPSTETVAGGGRCDDQVAIVHPDDAPVLKQALEEVGL